LVGQIGRHGAPKPSPDPQTKLQCQTVKIPPIIEFQQQKGKRIAWWDPKILQSVAGSTDQLKETSVNEAKATPPTIGTSEPSTGREGTCRRDGERAKQKLTEF
jgi:hypothetical protein